MTHSTLASLTGTISSLVGDHGVYAVFALMALDAVFPAASELVLLYAGALAAGTFPDQHVVVLGSTIGSGPGALVAIALAGTLGYALGALGGWAIGAAAGRLLVERHGRLLHVGPERLARAERWFARWGVAAAALGRVIPLVRSFVSIPAGVLRQPLPTYVLMTLVGSAAWAFAFTSIGYAVGTNWDGAHRQLRLLDYAVVAAVVLTALWLLWRRRPARRPA